MIDNNDMHQDQMRINYLIAKYCDPLSIHYKGDWDRQLRMNSMCMKTMYDVSFMVPGGKNFCDRFKKDEETMIEIMDFADIVAVQRAAVSADAKARAKVAK